MTNGKTGGTARLCVRCETRQPLADLTRIDDHLHSYQCADPAACAARAAAGDVYQVDLTDALREHAEIEAVMRGAYYSGAGR